MVRRVDDVGNMSEKSETEYMMTELMPQTCCANMTPTTATIAGR